MKRSSLLYATLALVSLVALSSLQSVNAQCKRFSKTRVLRSIDAGSQLLYASAGHMIQGERAAVVIDAPQGFVSLDLFTHASLGQVEYSITDRLGHEIDSGTLATGRASIGLDLPEQKRLTVSIAVPQGNVAYTSMGCVGLAVYHPDVIELAPVSESVADIKAEKAQ
jgi:hypothetical protein